MSEWEGGGALKCQGADGVGGCEEEVAQKLVATKTAKRRKNISV